MQMFGYRAVRFLTALQLLLESLDLALGNEEPAEMLVGLQVKAPICGSGFCPLEQRCRGNVHFTCSRCDVEILTPVDVKRSFRRTASGPEGVFLRFLGHREKMPMSSVGVNQKTRCKYDERRSDQGVRC